MARPVSWRIVNHYSGRKESPETLSTRVNQSAIEIRARPRHKRLQRMHTHSEAKSWSYFECHRRRTKTCGQALSIQAFIELITTRISNHPTASSGKAGFSF